MDKRYRMRIKDDPVFGKCKLFQIVEPDGIYTDAFGSELIKAEVRSDGDFADRVLHLLNAADDLGLSTEDIQDGILREMVTCIQNMRNDMQDAGYFPDCYEHADAILAKLDKEG